MIDWPAQMTTKTRMKMSTHVIVEVLRGDARDKRNVLRK
jgi:hypothetical protein